MKTLWIVLFVILNSSSVFTQFYDSPLHLKKTNKKKLTIKDNFRINTGVKVRINNILVTYKGVDYINEKIIVYENYFSGNNVINFKDIKIIEVRKLTKVFSSAGYGFRNGAILGFIFGPSIYKTLTGDNPYDDTFVDQKLVVNTVFAYHGSLIGLPIGLVYGIFFTNKWSSYIISKNKWMISK